MATSFPSKPGFNLLALVALEEFASPEVFLCVRSGVDLQMGKCPGQGQGFAGGEQDKRQLLCLARDGSQGCVEAGCGFGKPFSLTVTAVKRPSLQPASSPAPSS